MLKDISTEPFLFYFFSNKTHISSITFLEHFTMSQDCKYFRRRLWMVLLLLFCTIWNMCNVGMMMVVADMVKVATSTAVSTFVNRNAQYKCLMAELFKCPHLCHPILSALILVIVGVRLGLYVMLALNSQSTRQSIFTLISIVIDWNLWMLYLYAIVQFVRM